MKYLRWSIILLALAFGMSAFAQKYTIVMIPKLVGIGYFNATKKGGEEAAKQLGDVRFIYRGPSTASATDQVQLINNFITAGVDAILVSANDPKALAPVLQKAMKAGIKVVTFDADADARDVFVNQATYAGIGKALVDEMAKQVGDNADLAVVTSSFTAPNQVAWIDAMKKTIAADYPDLNIVTIQASGENEQKALSVTQSILNAYPNVKGIFGMASTIFPGAAEAVQQAGLAGKVAVVGLSTPNQMKPFMKSGVVKADVLWNPVDLGYLAVYVAHDLLTQGPFKAGDQIDAGKLGQRTLKKDDISLWVLLGPPFVFTPENVDKFNF
jgi:rhamnose transport system substrate-binding protein